MCCLLDGDIGHAKFLFMVSAYSLHPFIDYLSSKSLHNITNVIPRLPIMLVSMHISVACWRPIPRDLTIRKEARMRKSSFVVVVVQTAIMQSV